MSHQDNAEQFNNDFHRTTWHDETLWHVRTKRDKAAYSTADFQQLRDAASAIKDHTLSNLSQYLVEFERNALENGAQVHWASNAREHNQIVLDIINRRGSAKVVKSKSMLTEECHLNRFLEENKIEVTDTDLGEHIVQLRKERPSHIVLPAIHLKVAEVSQTFQDHKYTMDKNSGAVELTRVARSVLRKKFIQSSVAITGVNFAVAETGGIVVCTNEGNADLGVNIADVHIAAMGIEKVIPSFEHLAVFTRLLARSATGQAITTYNSHFRRPVKGKELHIIIVDNGRSEQLAREDFRASLKCIRCGACMNTCPVYRRNSWTHSPRINPWAKARDLPKPPAQSFNSWYKQNGEDE